MSTSNAAKQGKNDVKFSLFPFLIGPVSVDVPHTRPSKDENNIRQPTSFFWLGPELQITSVNNCLDLSLFRNDPRRKDFSSGTSLIWWCTDRKD